MSMHAPALPAAQTTTLRVLEGGATRRSTSWWEKRSMVRLIVGGCPDHWWKPTAPRTGACTCDRY